jgi:hypothetical protein
MCWTYGDPSRRPHSIQDDHRSKLTRIRWHHKQKQGDTRASGETVALRRKRWSSLAFCYRVRGLLC